MSGPDPLAAARAAGLREAASLVMEPTPGWLLDAATCRALAQLLEERALAHLTADGGPPAPTVAAPGRHLDAALTALDRAVHDPGANPGHHARVMVRHQREWPTLWRALGAVLAAHRQSGSPR